MKEREKKGRGKEYKKSSCYSGRLFTPANSYIFSYSILWPIQNIQKGDECTRDFLFGIGEDKQRSARLTAWFHTPRNYFIQVLFCLADKTKS